MREIAVRVNGTIRRGSIKDNELLLDFIRDKLEVKSVKAACWRGECGLCTVQMNGRLVKSCLVLAVEADGGDVKTVEGIAEKGELAPIQKAFIEHGASQCGFCTPAWVLTSHDLLKRIPDPTDEEIETAVAGLLCRCGTYAQVKEAIHSVARSGKKIQLEKLVKSVG